MPLEIFKNDGIEFKQFIFSGGEVGFKLDENNHRFKHFNKNVAIVARIQKSEDFFALAMATDALRRFQDNPIELFLPYTPYARQDRTCVGGESFSLKVFADLLNSLNFEKVTVFDPHSHVIEACINKVKVVSQYQIISKWEGFKRRIFQGTIFVSPDAGANKKTSEIAGYFQHKEFIRADKLRDLSNGNIKETVVYCDNLKGEDVVILDDICDGGRTFIELAKVLKKKNSGKVILYVTHGIFSQGLDVLYKNGIDEIWTTNSFKTEFTDFPEYPVRTRTVEPTAILDIKELIQ